ncbi:rhodanese-like domain-containing protein [Maridesulfovibrio sp. FT414]|uniref:rhodanese-like domain-containing protein n=1 Tax=Maridesulfovibrio sp. FT414 TaxID=2979469 RepID=UPI003D807B7E
MKDQINFYEAKLEYEIDSADLFQAINDGMNVVVVDARTSEAFMSEHIPGAINMPHRQLDENSTCDLKMDCLYVTYCDGIGCNASTKGALKLARLGFKVKELLGGLDWWKRDGYATEGLKAVNDDSTIGCAC